MIRKSLQLSVRAIAQSVGIIFRPTLPPVLVVCSCNIYVFVFTLEITESAVGGIHNTRTMMKDGCTKKQF